MKYEALKQKAAERTVNGPPAPQGGTVSRNHGVIDPDDIFSSIAAGGYAGLDKALQKGPDAVIDEVARSGLRGLGGCAYPTGAKWRAYRDVPSPKKYMICNAVESGGAQAVRMLLESDPHSVLEGVLIAAYAIGADHGYLCINQAHTAAIEKVLNALNQMREVGLLGEGILGYAFDFDIELKTVGNDFINGEETALLRLLAGEKAMPYAHPPLPAVLELQGAPACIHSAETLANVTRILQYGAENFTGTKLITLSGAAENPGVYEMPLNGSFHEAIEKAGGVAGGKGLKALLAGGELGVLLPEAELGEPLEIFHREGSYAGTGEIRVLDNGTCMVDLAKECMAYAHRESCGKCVLCREGTYQLERILSDMTEGKAKTEDLKLVEEICSGMKDGGICGYCRAVAKLVSSSLQHFREEYEMHISRKRCPALVCKKYVTFHILGEKCQGCGKCLDACPEDAIEGEDGYIHVIDQDTCTHCGLCLAACPAEYTAITKAGLVKPRTPEEPIPVGTWKKR